MKYSITLILTTLLFNINSLQAQKDITVTGKVIDKDVNQPLEYATIAFFSKAQNKIVTGGITDVDGNFSIAVPSGTYDITVEYIGYKTRTLANRTLDQNVDLGTLGIGVDAQSLNEVTVVAERTTVEIKLDKKVYNIGSDLTTSGGTVSDALNNVPSVAVDIEGGISLRGNENVRILINGKPSAMAGFGDTNVLSQLPAEAIERVEVITSPSARYDAEGTAGIINIILRQKETLGFNGSLNLNIGTPDNYGFSSNLNLRKEKYNLFTNFGWRYFDAPRISFSDANYFGNEGDIRFDRIREDQDVERLNRNYNANVGMEYFINDASSITGSLFYRYGEDADISLNNSDRFNDGIVEERTLRREKQTEEDNSYQISLNYINRLDDDGQQLTADLQFGKDKEIQETFISENYFLTIDDEEPEAIPREEVFTTEKQSEYLFQFDYVLPLGEDSRFEAGYRDSYQNEITDYNLTQEEIEDNIATGNLEINDALSNVFDYTEHVTAVYSQYGSKFGKFSFLLGLRLENTRLKGDIDSRLSDEDLEEFFGFPIQTKFDNNYLGLFPTVNLIYNLAKEDEKEESVTLGYNRRINRPRGWFINPFPSRSSRTNVFQGNPNLRPAFASAFDLGYLKRWEDLTLTTSVYYQHETNAFERVEENTGQETTDGIDIIRTIPVNLSTNERIGAELGILYNPAKWLRLNSSVNFFQFQTKGDFNGIDYGAKNTSYFARFSSKVTLPAKIDWQTNVFYSGAQENAQTKTEGIFSMDLAFSKEIFKDRATISLNARDVFNSRIRESFTTTERFSRYSENQWRPRQITLSLIYRFNQQKKQQRNRQNGQNGDEEMDFEG